MTKHAVFLFLLLVALVVPPALSESSPVKACCTQYREKPISVRWFKYYIVQDIHFCNIKAIIFVTLKNKPVCANPDSEWVKKAMETVPGKRPL